MAEPSRSIPLYARLGLAVLLGGFASAPLFTVVFVGMFAELSWLWTSVLGLLAVFVVWVLCWALAAATPMVTAATGTPSGRRGWALVIALVTSALAAALFTVFYLTDQFDRGVESVQLGLIGAVSMGLAVLVDWLLRRRRVTG